MIELIRNLQAIYKAKELKLAKLANKPFLCKIFLLFILIIFNESDC